MWLPTLLLVSSHPVSIILWIGNEFKRASWKAVRDEQMLHWDAEHCWWGNFGELHADVTTASWMQRCMLGRRTRTALSHWEQWESVRIEARMRAASAATRLARMEDRFVILCIPPARLLPSFAYHSFTRRPSLGSISVATLQDASWRSLS